MGAVSKVNSHPDVWTLDKLAPVAVSDDWIIADKITTSTKLGTASPCWRSHEVRLRTKQRRPLAPLALTRHYTEAADGDWTVVAVHEPARCEQAKPDPNSAPRPIVADVDKVRPTLDERLSRTDVSAESASADAALALAPYPDVAAKLPIIPSPISSELTIIPSPTSTDFLHVSSASSVARSFADQRPRTATALLWAWLLLLVVGELALTIWWLGTLGALDLVTIFVPVIVTFLSLFSVMTPQQVAATSISIILAAMPAMPAYSAVLLVRPPPAGSSLAVAASATAPVRSLWQVDCLHWVTLMSLGMLHFVAAFSDTVRQQQKALRDLSQVLLDCLAVAQQIARAACFLAMCAYSILACILVFNYCCFWMWPEGERCAWCSRARLLSTDSSLAMELSLNALGLACAEMRRQTCAALGKSLLPRLIGAQRARKLSLRQLTSRYGLKVLRYTPNLWRYSPPAAVIACILAIERLAPLLLPALALLMRMGYVPSGVLMLALLVLSLVALLERRSIPDAPLRRLTLLIPNAAVTPHAREALGYALEAAARVEVTRATVWGWLRPLRHQLRRHSSSFKRKCKDTLLLESFFPKCG